MQPPEEAADGKAPESTFVEAGRKAGEAPPAGRDRYNAVLFSGFLRTLYGSGGCDRNCVSDTCLSYIYADQLPAPRASAEVRLIKLH